MHLGDALARGNLAAADLLAGLREDGDACKTTTFELGKFTPKLEFTENL